MSQPYKRNLLSEEQKLRYAKDGGTQVQFW